MNLYLWGEHRIKGWERLQGPTTVEVLEQYQSYFASDTLHEFYSCVPFSGFNGDRRTTYTAFSISARKPKASRQTERINR